MATPQPIGHSEVSAAEAVFGMLEAEDGPETSPTPQTPASEQAPIQAAAETPRQEPAPAPAGEPETPPQPETAEGEVAPDGEPAESDDGTRLPETVAELAEALETEADWIYGLRLGEVQEADGTRRALTLGEAKDVLNDFVRAKRGTAELAQRQAQFEQHRAASQQETHTALQQAQALLHRLAAAYAPESLKQSEPGAWADRQQELQGVAAEVQRLQQQQAEQSRARWHASRAQAAQAEFAKLREIWPEWADVPTAQAHHKRLVDGAVAEYGFDPQEAAQVYDSKVLRMIDDALKFRRGEGRASEARVKLAEKRALKLPRIMKPGTPTTADERRAEAKNEQMNVLRQMGRAGYGSAAAMPVAASLVEGMLDDM